MYRKILIPLDGSERAEQVLPHVRELAQGRNTKLLLVHVVEPPMVAMPMVAHGAPTAAPVMVSLDDALTRTREEAKAYLQGAKERLESEGLSCETVLEQGGVVQQIVDVADEHDVDLIAMTSHGRTGLATAFFGSVAVGVLHRITRPLLLVRAQD
jgi:nucleotide-binding universal stress UspA family protein